LRRLGRTAQVDVPRGTQVPVVAPRKTASQSS
jgi:hypothetical protein